MHILALTVATVSNVVLGSLWYSLLFGKMWQQAEGISDEQIKAQGTTPYIFALVCSFLSAVGFNYLVMNSISLENNLFIGLIVGILVAASMCINYQFSGRDNKSFLINAGYHIARFVIYALVFWFIKN